MIAPAGLLPDPTRSVASCSIAFNAYGLTYMPFLAESIAVSTRSPTAFPDPPGPARPFRLHNPSGCMHSSSCRGCLLGLQDHVLA